MSGDKEFMPDAGEEFSADELAAIERMQMETPMPTKNEGGDVPAGGEGDKPSDPAPKAQRKAAADADDADGSSDLEDGEEEISIDGQGRAHGKDGQFVSKSAFLRVKGQHKNTRAELETERAARAKLEGRLDILTEIINGVPGADGKPAGGDKAKTANPWDEPDIEPAADIFAAFDQQKRRNAWDRQQRTQQQADQTQRDQVTADANAYLADAKRLAADQVKRGEVVTIGDGEHAQTVPAIHAAYMHMVSVRHAQLEAVGIADKSERDRRIAAEELLLVREATAAKRSPAEMIFALAKASGFRMPDKAAGGTKPNGKTPQQLEAERKLSAINDSMKATLSLSGKGGQAATGVSRADIIAMDDDTFAAFVDKLGQDQINRMLGAE